MTSQSIDSATTQLPLHRMPSSTASSLRGHGSIEPVAVSQAEQSVAKPTDQQVQKAVHELQKAIAPLAAELKFSVDEDTGRTVVKVLDTATGKVLKQFPSEEILQVSKSIEKFRLGLLVDKQV